MRGKAGRKGDAGPTGPKGEKGDKGDAVMPPIVSTKIDEHYNLCVLRSDNSLEIIPLREAFERFVNEIGSTNQIESNNDRGSDGAFFMAR